MTNFGIIIASCTSDAHYAKACLYSIRYFLGEVPVCLFVDGDTSIFDSARRISNITVMSNNELHDPWLRAHCRGWGHTKMAMLWASPFEHFLYLDADTIVWGDLLGTVKDLEYDFVVDQQHSYSDAEIAQWFFDPAKLLRHYPDFNYSAFRGNYACNGTFFARRGALDLELYKQAYAIQQQDDSVFYPADMGIWNFLVFYSAQKHNLHVLSQQYQVIPVDHAIRELRDDYSPLTLERRKTPPPAVIHFCGKKAHIFSISPKVTAMNHFRCRYLLEHEKLSRWKAFVTMACEDARYVFWAKAKKGWAKLQRLLRRLGERYGQLLHKA